MGETDYDGGATRDGGGSDPSEQANSLLLEEFSHWGDALLQSEESGTSRVTILLAAVAAAATALPILPKPESGSLPSLFPSLGLFLALLLLLLVGLNTLSRLVGRNLETDRCMLRRWNIRMYFAQAYKAQLLARRYPLGLVRDPSAKTRVRPWHLSVLLVGEKGGHVELVEWANAALVAMLAGVGAELLVPGTSPERLVAIGLAVGVAFRLYEFGDVNDRYGQAALRKDVPGLLSEEGVPLIPPPGPGRAVPDTRA